MIVDNKLPSSFTKRDVLYRYSAVFILAIMLVLGSAAVFWHTQKEVNKLNQESAILDAEHFVSSVAKYRTFYSKVVVSKAKEFGMDITHDYIGKEGALPLPATFAKDFGEFVNKEGSNFKIKLYSDQPFKWRRTNVVDDFELTALEQLKENPDLPIWTFQELEGESVLRYVKADVLSESCIACHNSYVGTPKNDWKVGDVRGALEIVLPMSRFESTSLDMIKQSFLMMLLLILLMVGLLYFVLKKLSGTIKISYNAYLSSETANEQLHAEIKQREIFSHNLKASEAKLRAIVNSVDEVIVVIDRRGIITECNLVVEKIFGYRVDEVVGQNIQLLMTSEHAGHHDGYIDKFVVHSQGNVMGRNREFYAKRKNGEIFPIDLFVNDARVGDDIIFTGTIRDVTDRKKTEEIREAAHNTAIESAKLKSDFLANMSHEIRTPMNGVIGMTEMLLMSELDVNQQDLAQTVKESAESLLVIINDILDYSKIEAGKLEIHEREFNLLNMVESSFDLLASVAEKKQIGIAFFIDQSVPLTIESDPVRLRQVIINLLNNALKFTEHGYVILHIEQSKAGELKFSIIDTGIGIPEDHVATLFDMFSQVDSSMSREHGGTGLGLAICKQLVNLMGGDISVHSIQNVGSTFWFTIQVEQPEHPQQPYIVAPSRVLMLNPELVLSQYYRKQMQQWQMKPTIVSNVNHLIRQSKDDEFDLIAIDVDAIFLEFQQDYGVLSVLAALRENTTSPVILYALPCQLRKLETLTLGDSVKLLSKPIKHSAIKQLFQDLMSSDIEEAKQISKPVLAIEGEKKPAKKKATNDQKIRVNGEVEAADVIPKSTPDNIQKVANYRVLLAEDNRVNQKVAVAILGKFNCDVIVAENGEVAVVMAEKETFDIIFMDCQMPIMDGYEATENIRQLTDDYQANIPVIAFTAHAMKDDDTKCKESGMDDYLSKPIDIGELKSVLKRWEGKMDERRQHRLNNEGEIK